ncbi:MAG: hypothetical protein GWO24_32405, partial [Akkermansiaceae bacterium]|nr:hypothetical protein [Akkermansiaceae bacterium]
PEAERSGVLTTVSISQPGANAPVAITLLGVGSVSGTVFQSDGVTPTANATVTLRSTSASLGKETRTFVTPADGSFAFPG